MANHLNMATIQAVLQLHAQRWSFRRIATELQIDRETVSRYVRLAEAKPVNAPTGSDAAGPADPEPVGAGDPSPGVPKPANAPTGSEGRIPAPGDGLPPAVREFRARQPNREGRSAVRAASRADPGEARPGTFGPADLSGSGGGARLHGQVLTA